MREYLSPFKGETKLTLLFSIFRDRHASPGLPVLFSAIYPFFWKENTFLWRNGLVTMNYLNEVF